MPFLLGETLFDGCYDWYTFCVAFFSCLRLLYVPSGFARRLPAALSSPATSGFARGRLGTILCPQPCRLRRRHLQLLLQLLPSCNCSYNCSCRSRFFFNT